MATPIIFISIIIFLSSAQGISTDPKDIKFLLYKKEGDVYETLNLNIPTSIKRAYFINGPTKILFHGFGGDGGSPEFPQDVKDAYLEKNQMNIIIVDYGPLATFTSEETILKDFKTAMDYNLEFVARKTHELIELLYMEYKIDSIESMHLIGHGLGAHIAARVASLFWEQSELYMQRITGLDPAGLYFDELEDDKNLLDKYDAHIVDNVHTDMGGMGTKWSKGMTNFVVNGGSSPQPGCPNVKSDPANPFKSFCSHIKAANYFAQSIRSEKPMVACGPCRDTDYRACKAICEKQVNFGDKIPNDPEYKTLGVYVIDI